VNLLEERAPLAERRDDREVRWTQTGAHEEHEVVVTRLLQRCDLHLERVQLPSVRVDRCIAHAFTEPKVEDLHRDVAVPRPSKHCCQMALRYHSAQIQLLVRDVPLAQGC